LHKFYISNISSELLINYLYVTMTYLDSIDIFCIINPSLCKYNIHHIESQ